MKLFVAIASEPVQPTANRISCDSGAEAILSTGTGALLQQPLNSVDFYYTEGVSRRAALSSWLKSIVEQTVTDHLQYIQGQKQMKKGSKQRVEEEEEDNEEETSDEFLLHQGIFALLTGKQIQRAAEMASQHGEYRLALLLSQLAASNSVAASRFHRELQMDIQRQLESWLDTQVIPPTTLSSPSPTQWRGTSLISTSLLKLYRLLTGDVDGVCDYLDWKRCLALHTWYPTSSAQGGGTIADILIAYETAVQQGLCTLPLPPYLESFSSSYAALCSVRSIPSIPCAPSPPLYLSTTTASRVAVTSNATLYTYNRSHEQEETQCWTKPCEPGSTWKEISCQRFYGTLSQYRSQPTGPQTSSSSLLSLTDVSFDTNYHLLKLFCDRYKSCCCCCCCCRTEHHH